MKPTSLSATAIQVFEACPARYKAENIERSKGFGGVAASLGSAVHGALELYVKAVYLDKKEPANEKLLLDLFKLSYADVFNSSDFQTVEYVEGYEMLSKWYARTDFEGVRVVSAEIKSFFEVPTPIGPLPFNYIWDRFDEIRPGEFKVVDYKTNRWGLKSSDLQKKIQARAYGLAAAIQLKREGIEYKRIWVEFDLLRHSPVGRVFTRDDNAAFWHYLKATAETIVNTPDDKVPEKLNAECLFCVRKVQCNALKKNVAVGGIHTVSRIEDAIDLRAQLEWQKKGLDSLIKDIDVKIMAEAKLRDMHEFESDINKLVIGVSSNRAVDPDMVSMAIGPELFEKYGSHSITMANVDKLLKGKELSATQKAQLRGLIHQKSGDPKVRVEARNPIDEE